MKSMISPAVVSARSDNNMSYGCYFDEIEVGQEFHHWPGRTINEYDDTLLSLLSMNHQPLHLDEHYSKRTQHGRRLVAGPAVIGIVIGMTQADIGGRAIETLEYSNVRHEAPVFHGDTIYAESVIVAKQPLPDQRGIVVVDTKGVNQRKETVLTLRRRIIVPARPRGEQA